MTEEQLSALLRLKRYEQPPPGYFDRLLQDVHRRQRSELLQRPLWQIAVERLRVFFSEHSMGQLTYAGSMAAVLVVGFGAIGLMTQGGDNVSNRHASTATPRPVTGAPARIEKATAPADGFESAARPRYIIDARPVSYEPTRNFSF